MKLLPLIFILLLGLGLRVYKLDTIPGEMWGDVIEHYKFVEQVKNGQFYWHYAFGGDGPSFTYFALIISKLTGLSFLSLKLTSALIGLGMIWATYLFGKELFNHLVGLYSAFFGAVLFWAISFSRQAKPYILVPTLIAIALYLLLKKRYVWAGLVIGLGAYTQAAYWGALFLAGYNFVTFWVALFVLLPFIFNLPKLLSAGDYVGSKMALEVNMFEKFKLISQHFAVNIRAFWMSGDPGFRHNIPRQPLLDPITGVLFLVGIIMLGVHIWNRKNRKVFGYIFLPLFFILLPSAMDIATRPVLPNMGRMIGILPIVCVVCAYALWRTSLLIRNRFWNYGFLAMVLCLTLLFSTQAYFVRYPKTLPNNNVPFGKIIAEYINQKMPDDVPIVMVHCCWGEGGQPEPNAIRFQLIDSYRFYDWAWDADFKQKLEKQFMAGQSIVFIANPDESTKKELMSYLDQTSVEIIQGKEWPAAIVYKGVLKD